jgi:signal transduction histidine kinase
MKALRLRPRTVRMRLALIYALAFLTLGIALTLTLVLSSHTGGAVVVGPPGPEQVLRYPGGLEVTPIGIVHQQLDADRHRVLVAALAVLVAAALVSVPLGWFASGRMLRPIREITARAQMISAGSLHQRLALSGPDDEFKRLGDTLDELLARLEASFEAQRRFVANASHELRTPLTVERTLLQVALADPDATAATLRATCEELLASGREHERLLEAMLTLAGSERPVETIAELDLALLAAPLLQRAQDGAQARALQVESDLRPAPARGDAALLERLLANLLSNAIDHNLDGGILRLRTGVEAERGFLEVENSGALIAPEQVEALFEPFRRGQARIGADGAHHGLGLSIVRAIAQAHDARIEARPREGGGLVIRISFPPLAPTAQ